MSPREWVNINAVDEAALIRGLSGAGEFKARAILEYRAACGPFVLVDQLLEVKGVGLTLLEKDWLRIVIERGAAEGTSFRLDNEKAPGMYRGL